MHFLQKILFVLALFVLPLSAQAEEQELTQGEDLKTYLPCKSPDGKYPWYLHAGVEQGEVPFSLICRGEGRPWTVLIPLEVSEALQELKERQ